MPDAHDASRGEERLHGGSSHARAEAKTRKSAATRDKIMAAATELMLERGSTSFQMSEVSERCELSKGSLYYYFSDKDALLKAVFDRSVVDLADTVERIAASASSAFESILELARVLAGCVRPGAPLAFALARGVREGEVRIFSAGEAHASRIVSVLAAQIERAKGEGLVRPSVNSRRTALALTGAFAFFDYAAGAGYADASFGDNGEDADAAVREVLGFVFAGIGTPSARELFSLSEPGLGADAGGAAPGSGSGHVPAPVPGFGSGHVPAPGPDVPRP